MHLQKKQGNPPPPITMIFLREALEDASLSYNRQGELVHQAILTRGFGKNQEQFVVMYREQNCVFFHFRWNPLLKQGEGDWEAVNAISAESLEGLYTIADDKQQLILDSSRWFPI